MEQPPVLEVRRLGKRFPRGLHSFPAVADISFALAQGEILGFLGPNGAGKTTTIKCILGLLFPSSGSVSVWGHAPGSPRARRRLGYVPENPDYEDYFSPIEFLRMFSGMRGIPQSPEEMDSLLGRVGLAGWEGTRIRQFSKGMRQRLSLALALQFGPSLLVLDEPTGGLDPSARKQFRDIIQEENARGASVFLSSHLLSEVETVCDRAVILSRGRIVREGAMSDLRRTEDEYRVVFRKPGAAGTAEETVHEAALQERLDALRRDGFDITGIGQVFRSLEEVFLSATEEDST